MRFVLRSARARISAFFTIRAISAPIGAALLVASALAGDLPTRRLEQLAGAASTAAATFRPVEAGAVDSAASALRESMRPLAALLARSPSGDDWKAYLDWTALEQQATGGAAADPATLRRLEGLLDASETGLDMPDFVRVRRAVTRYAEVAEAARGAGAQRSAQRLESLAAALRAAAADGTLTSLNTAGPTLERLSEARQAPDVVRDVRATFGRPNMILELHEKLFAQAVDRPVDEVQPIRDTILGTCVTGVGHTSGLVYADFVPSTDRAAFDIVLAATNQSRTRGTKGPITAHSSGLTDVTARRRVFIDAGTVSAGPVCATASTDTHLDCIDVHTRFAQKLIARFAERKIAKMKPQIEAIAESKARDRTRKEFTEQTDPGIARIESEFRDRVRRRLEARDFYPESIALHSTDTAFVATARKASPVQLAACNPPPAATASGNVLTTRIHESALNNALEQQFGGKRFTQDAAAMADEFGAEMPASLGSEEDQQPWEITFTKQRPVTVTAADGKLTFMVRGNKFVSGERDFPGMDISATYAIRRGPNGFSLVRDGDVQIYPPGFKPGGGEKLSPAETSLRRILQRRFDKLLKAEIEIKDLPLEGELAKAGPLPMNQFESHADGWVVAGWRAKAPGTPAAPAPAAPPEPAVAGSVTPPAILAAIPSILATLLVP